MNFQARGLEAAPWNTSGRGQLPKLTRIILTKIFKRATVRLSKGEREGLSRGVKMILKHRALVAAFIISGIAAAIFEGGTLGLLGLLVSVLIGDQEVSFGAIPGPVGNYVDTVLQTTSRGGLFLLLVGFAVTAQIFKSLLVYLCLVVQIYLTTILSNFSSNRIMYHICRPDNVCFNV